MQAIYESPISLADEGNAVEHALQRQAERDPDYFGPPRLSPDGPARSGTPGSIRDLCFMDVDTCFWQVAQLHSLHHTLCSSSSLPYIGVTPGTAL